MGLRACLLLLLALVVACGSSEEVFVDQLSASVVYGTDDRLEVFNHGDPALQDIARKSVVALIPTTRIFRQPDGFYALSAFSLKDARGLCDDEPFANQPVAASCSGVLIDHDLVLTAGHCVNQQTCQNEQYVFNYYLDGPDSLAPIRDEDVYTCERVLLDEDPSLGAITPDFALIQLDRPVEGSHEPVAVRPASPLQQNAPISMIGFGSGLPAKIDSGARVADPRASQMDYFVANLDAFEGHSGAATFDSDNRLAGILLGGRVPDYVLDPMQLCSRANVFQDSEAGEFMHNIAPIISALCDSGWQSDTLCAPDSCEGQPCGQPSKPGGGAVAPAQSSGCGASQRSAGAGSFWAGLLLFAVARRFRRSIA